ncbi:MAG: beta-CASP ribonuclease aCPSF1 [Thermoplasmata archaeon]|nr:beta-CASP ribonuclease aCPSF1 [Thermoplasmata archaeon]
MALKHVYQQVEDTIKQIVPPTVKISSIEFEGPLIVIYTKTVGEFADNGELIKKLAQSLRRRVSIRPDPSILADMETADKVIRELISEEAGITDIFYQYDTGEVIIEVRMPGMAIGKYGATLNEIKKRIGWAPKVIRTPPIESKTIQDIRGYLRSVGKKRRTFLKKVGDRIVRGMSDKQNWVRVTTLGGWREVGRSCALLSTANSKVLIDLGLNVSSDENASPYLNAPELMPLDSIDAVVLTHAHLDHCGLVPVLFKYGYDGPIYATQPTRDLAALLQLDYIKVSSSDTRKTPYDSEHVRDAVTHTIPLKYGETTDITPDVRLTLHNAGHIIGSATAHFHVGDGLHNIAFSGDMKYEKTLLFNQAVNKFPRLETLVMESTYGGRNDNQPARKDAVEALRAEISHTLDRGGCVLIPVFAVGRSQEVMLVLEQLMRQNRLKKVPIYLDGMIWEATAIHTAYPEYLNNQLRKQVFQQTENPFLSDIFKRVDSSEMRNTIRETEEQCIVLATAGMLNGGPVLEYFRQWAPDERNGIIFVGYQAEGTIGRKVQRGWEEIPLQRYGSSQSIKVGMKVSTVDGFSGHSDRRQLMNYVHKMDPKPERILIGHGDESKCMDLASSIYRRYGIETRVPMNLESIRFR